MHVLIQGEVVTYPYSPARLRADNPGTSFPLEMTEAALAEWGVYPVTGTEQPGFAFSTHRIAEGAPEQVEGAWVQAWVVTDLTSEEIADALAQWRQSATLTRFQARAALLQAGLLEDVEAAVAGSDAFTKLAWTDAQTFERASPTIATLATALGLTAEQVDDLFRAAATITA